MKLRLQLTLISLAFLGLPWAGCALLSENEQALRAAQTEALQTTANAMASALSNQPEMLYSDPNRAKSPFDSNSLFSYDMADLPILDGYLDEWSSISAQRFSNGEQQLQVKVAADDKQVYLAINVFGSTPNWYNPALGYANNGDRLMLTTWIGQQRQAYVIATTAPGAVRADSVGRRLAGASAAEIKGWWIDTGSGHQLELQLPRHLATSRLGVQFITVNEGGATYLGNMSPLTTDAPPWLAMAPPQLALWIERFSDNRLSMTVLDRWGWPMGTTTAVPQPTDDSVFWVLRWLYRQILTEPEALALPSPAPNGQWTRPEINQALMGLTNSKLYKDQQELLLSVAAPIRSQDGVIGVVNLSQPRENYLSLSDGAFASWLLRSLIALSVAVGGILLFALITSWRIRRLSLIVARADHAGATSSMLPTTRLNDEIDHLANDFNRLLNDVQGYQQYLTTLTHTLAHELRTPIAVIASSLENLTASDIDAAQKEVLRLRAVSGLERLASMLNAMNESNRLESALTSEKLSKIDLVALLTEVTAAYKTTFHGWDIGLKLDVDSAYADANADLIVQALDKLIENATSFAAESSTITVSLDRRGLWWRLTVSNVGPQLPDNDPKHLFDPLVSHRKSKTQGGIHLGIGLHIVKLIARHHGGGPVAFNRADIGGVCVGLTLRA